MFAFFARHRIWTLGVALAFVTASLVFAFAIDGSSHGHRADTANTAPLHNTQPPVYGVTIQNQLKAQGYKLAATSTYDSSDAGRTINGEMWMRPMGHGQPIVFLTDAYPGMPGTFVIDTISYGQTAGYQQFWCVSPTLKDKSNLTLTLNAAAYERGRVLTNRSKPEPSGVTGTYQVMDTTLCYMK